MPIEFYRHMSDDDVKAIIAYLRAQPPVRNVVEKCVALCPTAVIPSALVTRALEGTGDELASFDEARAEFERDYLAQLLRITDGNVSQAAKLAKRNRSDFYSLLNRHELEPAAFKK